jgi:hypothetical protein
MNKTFKDILQTKYSVLYQKNQFNLEGLPALGMTFTVGATGLSTQNVSNPRPGILTHGIDKAGKAFYMSDTGAISYVNATGADQYNYIVGIRKEEFYYTSSNNPIAVVDRLWSNTGIDISTGSTGVWQSINSVQWPPRDDSGLSTGYGVYVGLEVGTTTTQTYVLHDIKVEYTNTDNVPFRTGNFHWFPGTATAKAFMIMSMDYDDIGVKSIQSINIPRALVAANSTTGSVHLVAFRPITMGIIGSPTDYTDAYQMGFTKIHNNSCLNVIVSQSYFQTSTYRIDFVIN